MLQTNHTYVVNIENRVEIEGRLVTRKQTPTQPVQLTLDQLGPEEQFEAYSKSPVVPFAPLHREIGVSFVDEIETREMTQERQQKIYKWVGEIYQPYDMIQRAEGWTSPDKVYYAGQNRAVKNSELGRKEKAVLRGQSGRAALRRHYRTTFDHFDIAQERFLAGADILRHIGKGRALDEEDAKMLNELLQELGNGVAANLDNRFAGGDEWARIAGNSILYAIDEIAKTGELPVDHTTLISASANYAGKQRDGWQKALKMTESFAQERSIPLSRERPVDS